MSDYTFGYSEIEARRLQSQAVLLEDLLRQGLARAGLQPGMKVLDIGSGVGDVSFLASKMVGPTGSVLGVDRGPTSLAKARDRAAALGITNVEFQVSELSSFDIDITFDAIIGRLILLYLPQPAAILSRLKSKLRRGGIVVFQEIDSSAAMQTPPSDIFAKVNGWIFGAYEATGAERDMGGKMARAFVEAGLPRPSMIGTTPVESGPDSSYYEFLTDMLRSLMPVVEAAGLASAAEIDIDTLTERLRRDAVENERTLYPPRIVTAWTRLPN